MFEDCKDCDYADLDHRGLKRTGYHLKYHHPIANLWWEPRYWLLTVKDFICWWACRDYWGKFSWRGFAGLKSDWELAKDIRAHLDYRT